MLTQKTQQWAKSCGAATSLVARVELGDNIRLTDANETIIYNQLKVPRGGLGAFEILPDKIATYQQQSGHNVAIIESNQTAGLLAIYPGVAPMYALYTHHVGASHFVKSMRDPGMADLANSARVFLVVKFAASDATHYILARLGDPPNNAQCYIMNPDPGSDEAIAFPAVGAAITTNVGGAFGGVARNYIFTGIAVRVW